MYHDYFKSRKIVDEEWKIGKSISQVRERYSCPKDIGKKYDSIIIDGEEYVFCVREIIAGDIVDGVEVEKLFCVKLDDKYRISDVRYCGWNELVQLSEYKYYQRWF